LRPFVSTFVEEHAVGVVRSLRYLERDRKRLEADWEPVLAWKALRVLRLRAPHASSRAAAAALKGLGYLLTGAERERLDRGESLVAGRRWAVEKKGDFLYIAPYLTGISIPKSFRERCRRCGIPPKIRPYCYRQGILPESLLPST
jgi:hypothetical protein